LKCWLTIIDNQRDTAYGIDIVVVIDTNVMYAGLRSKDGASFLLLTALADERFRYAISTTLLFEYEDVLKRERQNIWMSEEQIENFLNSIVTLGHRFSPHFLWRPFLKDSNDDHILELAVVSNSRKIVTYNIKDFTGSCQFGIDTMKPYDFLREEKLL